MKQFELTYKPFGPRSILLQWPNKIDENTLKDILGFKKRLIKRNIKSIVEITSAYNSLLITYDVIIDNIYHTFLMLESLYLREDNKKNDLYRLWKIPVCYDEEFSTDLTIFSNEKKMKKEAIIQLHSSNIYIVYFVGFLPGFLYLGGLDNKLYIPRKSTPNLNVKKGSVAIGGEQTGIYPQDSPGGWYVIGNSPISFFDASREKPCFASAGDKLQFVPVGIDDYNRIKKLVACNSYQLESEFLYG